MIEIVVLDKTDFILTYRHFPNAQVDEMAEYIKLYIVKDDTHKITLKKWKR